MRKIIALAFIFGSLSAPALAQVTAPLSRTIPVTFRGVVANDVTNEIRIRQPDGSYAAFQGPVPDYPYKRGDAVTLSFNAVVPTQAFYQPGSPYTGQIAADGIYRLDLFGQGGGSFGPGPHFALSQGSEASGPFSPAANFGQPTAQRVNLVYDSNADSYSIDFAGANGGFIGGAYAAPGYTYDSRTGAMTACTGQNCAPQPADNNLFTLGSRGAADTISTGNIGIYGTAPGNGPASGNRAGLFSLLFSGSWNLPTYGGGATQVPEPGMMLLFGGGAAALLRRRRKAA